MTIFRVVVLKIRARSDFFTIVDPNYIEITRRTNYFTGQFNFSTIFSLDRFQMIYDRRRTWLETWFFAWCCSKNNQEIITIFCTFLCIYVLLTVLSLVAHCLDHSYYSSRGDSQILVEQSIYKKFRLCLGHFPHCNYTDQSLRP